MVYESPVRLRTRSLASHNHTIGRSANSMVTIRTESTSVYIIFVMPARIGKYVRNFFSGIFAVFPSL